MPITIRAREHRDVAGSPCDRQPTLRVLPVPVLQQTGLGSCGLACTAMAIWHWTGRQVSQHQLAAELGLEWPVRGGTTMPQCMDLIGRHSGKKLRQNGAATLRTIIAAIDADGPVLATHRVSETMGHMVLVIGYIRDGPAHPGNAVLVADPVLRFPVLIPWPAFAASLRDVGIATRDTA